MWGTLGLDLESNAIVGDLAGQGTQRWGVAQYQLIKIGGQGFTVACQQRHSRLDDVALSVCQHTNQKPGKTWLFVQSTR